MSAGFAERCCEYCGERLVRHPKHSDAQWKRKRFCERQCAGAASRLPPRPCSCGCGEGTRPGRKYVKGHRPLVPTTQGYGRVWVGRDHPLAASDGNALAHRLVLFNAGISIPPGYQVHHKNGDKLDNRLENLEVLSAAEHTCLHHAKKKAA